MLVSVELEMHPFTMLLTNGIISINIFTAKIFEVGVKNVNIFY